MNEWYSNTCVSGEVCVALPPFLAIFQSPARTDDWASQPGRRASDVIKIFDAIIRLTEAFFSFVHISRLVPTLLLVDISAVTATTQLCPLRSYQAELNEGQLKEKLEKVCLFIYSFIRWCPCLSLFAVFFFRNDPFTLLNVSNVP